MGRNATPQGWPSSVAYLAQPSYSSHLSKAQRQSLQVRSVDLTDEIPAHLPRGPSASVRITPIRQPSHPANGQAGLFAARHLGPGDLILPYYGVFHSSQPPHSLPHEKSDYDLWLDRDANVAVDAATAGNEARFVNDYRGVGERPNAEFRECWDLRTRQKCMAVFVLPASKSARKGGVSGIAKGQEILVSYGKGFWSKRMVEHEVKHTSQDSEACES